MDTIYTSQSQKYKIYETAANFGYTSLEVHNYNSCLRQEVDVTSSFYQ